MSGIILIFFGLGKVKAFTDIKSYVDLLSSIWCLQEGPHSVLNEEEFYDAIEVALDRQDEVDALVRLSDCWRQGETTILISRLLLRVYGMYVANFVWTSTKNESSAQNTIWSCAFGPSTTHNLITHGLNMV